MYSNIVYLYSLIAFAFMLGASSNGVQRSTKIKNQRTTLEQADVKRNPKLNTDHLINSTVKTAEHGRKAGNQEATLEQAERKPGINPHLSRSTAKFSSQDVRTSRKTFIGRSRKSDLRLKDSNSALLSRDADKLGTGSDRKEEITRRQFIPRMFRGVPYLEQQYTAEDQEMTRRDEEGTPSSIYEGPCANSPCRHDSKCIQKRHGYYCSCAPGFIGAHCEARKECDPDTCKNGGTCTEEAQGKHLCTCAFGFRGENCEEPSKCHPNPCRNDGECSETEESYSCMCKEGFRGKGCADLNHCNPNPCKNSGTCFEQNGDFFCNCPAMYRGKTCEVVSECSTARCVNGGTCLDSSDGYTCKCPYGFFGKRCDVTACQPNPCLNGGLCSMFGDHHSCQCTKGYSGKQCEVHSPCSNSICMNGGTCVDSTFTNSRYGFACVCPHNYDGILCEKHLPTHTTDDDDDDDDDKRHKVSRTRLSPSR